MKKDSNRKKVTFIFPRFEYPSGDFSIGLAYIAGHVRESIPDIDISMIDTSFHPNMEFVKKMLASKGPDIVGIYADTISLKRALVVAKIAKSMNMNVIFGGPHVTVMPETVISSEYVDAICLGEGEITFKEYIEEFYNKKNFSKVKGIWFKKGKKIVRNAPRDPIPDIDALAFPAYDLFDIENYITRFVQLDSYNPNLRGVSIIVTRGCPFDCTYCQPTLKKIFGKKVRIRSPQKVIEELKMLKKNYRINAFYFQDDTLTVFKKWVSEFCELMRKEKMNLIWGCNTRADTVSYAQLKDMKRAGMVKVKMGIESITDRVRNGIYKKNVSRKQIEDVIRWCRKLKIQTTGFFMFGAPTETKKEIWNTIRFAARSGLVEANFSITTPLPQTHLFDYVKEHGWELPKDFSDFDYYKVKRPKMSRNEIDPKELDRVKKIAYFYFYLHPNRIFTTLKSVWGMQGIRKAMLKLKRV